MVRASAPNFQNPRAESGQTAWDALRASHALVGVSDESQIVVPRTRFELVTLRSSKSDLDYIITPTLIGVAGASPTSHM